MAAAKTALVPAGAATAASLADVYRNGRFEANDWQLLAAEAEVPAEGGVLLPLARFVELAQADALGNRPLGVVIAPADRIADILPHLDRLAVVAIDFPKFSDGRGFSHAAQLARAGYRGEVRAIGNVLIDQMTALKRLGFTAFEVRHGVSRRYLDEGRDPAPRRHYQPAIGDAPVGGPRPWLRQSAV